MSKISLKSDRRSVNNELKIMSVIKTLSQDAFEIFSVGNVYSFEQQQRILKMQLESVLGLKQHEIFSSKMKETIDLYIEQLNEKI